MARTKDVVLEKTRKAEILSAAARCFVKHGLHQASMRQICAEAKLSAGAVYNYFPSKDAIIEGIADDERAEIKEIEEYLATQTNAFDAVVQVARWIIEESSAHSVQLQLEMAAEAGRSPTINALVERNMSALKSCLLDAIIAGQSSKEITNSLSANDLCDCVTAVYDGFYGRLISADQNERERLASLTEKTVAQLLKP